MRFYLKIREFTPYEFQVQRECKLECAAYFSLFFSVSRGHFDIYSFLPAYKTFETTHNKIQ